MGEPSETDAEGIASEWKTWALTAKILASGPWKSRSAEDICLQILGIFHVPDSWVARQFQRVATTSSITLWREWPHVAGKYFRQYPVTLLI